MGCALVIFIFVCLLVCLFVLLMMFYEFNRKTYLRQSKFCITILRIVIYTNKKTGQRRERKLISFIYLSIYLFIFYLFRNFSQHIYIHSYKCLHDNIGEYICDSD